MCGSAFRTDSPFNSNTSRRTPWAEGCCGPKFKLKERICSNVFLVAGSLFVCEGRLFVTKILSVVQRWGRLQYYREIQGKNITVFVSFCVRPAFVRTATARLVVIFIEEKKRNSAVTLSIKYPPTYRIKVQKTIGKKVALSTCGICRLLSQ